ncbi:hypothetical protein HY745_02595 [Candidatus Desantisbacteria bacterium]|nr:hypothetical protein [Candidatus Desantisbacteria bacterium]
MPAIENLKRIAEIEFSDIVKTTYQYEYKLRIILINNTFIDVYLSQKLHNKFGFHWECKDKKKTIYRYDNFPDMNWQSISTFPYHFHNGAQDSVEASPFPLTAIEGFRAFMKFVKNKL